MDHFAAWLLAIMLTTAPPGHDENETIDQSLERYGQIATAIAFVAGKERPIFVGKHARERTALLMLSIAFLESGFLRNVDLGSGPKARGDKGRSWCLMQINVGTGKTPEGWSGQDLVQDRMKCLSAGLRAMRQSANACRAKGQLQWLNAYASGSCERGARESAQRMTTALYWMKKFPPPKTP